MGQGRHLFAYLNYERYVKRGVFCRIKSCWMQGTAGGDPGATYQGRNEKDDTLRLVLAIGQILENNGVDVEYTRTTDVYQTPFEKAQIANQSGADFFISIHRNSSPRPNQYSGVESLIYDKSGIKLQMAENINGALGEVGFKDLGVKRAAGACGT